METGHFYYIDDKYFAKFNDPYLMRNKENINGKLHDRPCFYTFKDGLTGLYRMIPFSSQTSKFRKIFNNKNIAIQLFLVKFLAMKKLFLFKICVR